jgi:hydrogenase maturation protein HypF
VRNDGDGVVIGLDATPSAREAFLRDLLDQLPPLARVDDIERTPAPDLQMQDGFHIMASEASGSRTGVPADAAACPACIAETLSPYDRRYRYPFTTCTHCGPRYSIALQLPLDRDTTTMRGFKMCPECRTEYEDASDRRFHAQPVACHVCGPKAWLERADGRAFSVERYSMMDAVDAVGSLLQTGEIVAIKGLGGFHLCCDATNEEAVARLRQRKRRFGKPFALMARDLEVVRRYAQVGTAEQQLLESPAAPIVLLRRAEAGQSVAPSVAPGQRQLGFMLPYTPLHHLVLKRVQRPIVCTSGNVSDEPQCIDDAEARERLGQIADWFLLHDRPIRNRVDDSVARVAVDRVQVMRRGRGWAPHSVPMPDGLSEAPLWSAGGQFKSTFCLAAEGRATASPHLGDLDEVRTLEAYARTRQLMQGLFAHRPRAVAVDLHPEYRATQLAREAAEADGIEVIGVQHHHAHVTSVMAEHRVPADAPPALGIALDGLGMGLDGELWGGEFLLANYASFQRVGTFKPVALLGGDAASQQPWRNLYAHLRAEQSWGELTANFGDLPVVAALRDRPVTALETVLASTDHSPLASSAGRLFDAVAAAVGIRFDGIQYEGQAAMELEAQVGPDDLVAALDEERYPIAIPQLPGGLPYLEWLGLWRAVLGDLYVRTPTPRIAARFHVALADALVRMAELVRRREETLATVVLGGGCFQNHILLELTVDGLRRSGFRVLFPERFPAHDGGLALGQAAVAAAQLKLRS